MRLKHKYATTKLNDEVIAVPVGDDVDENLRAIKMNEISAFILNLLKNETSIESIVDAVYKEYDAPRERIAADVERFIEALRKRELLVE